MTDISAEQVTYAKVAGSAIRHITAQHDLATLDPALLPALAPGDFEDFFVERVKACRDEGYELVATGEERKRLCASGGPNRKDEAWWLRYGPKYVQAWIDWRAARPEWEIAYLPDGSVGIDVPVSHTVGDTVHEGVLDRVFLVEGTLVVVGIEAGEKPPVPLRLAGYRAALEEQYGLLAEWGAHWLGSTGTVDDLYDLEKYDADWIAQQLAPEPAVEPIITTQDNAPQPGTDEWHKSITGSKVAAILGISPWDSPRSMWHKMRGEVPNDDGKNAGAKARGHYLENGVLDWWEDQHPELSTLFRQPFIRRPDIPWGAVTPDLLAQDESGFVIVDAKTSVKDDEWGEPGTHEMPPYYRAQLMWAMHLSGAKVAYIALLNSRLQLSEYVLHYDPVQAKEMEERLHRFYLSVQDPKGAPPIDGHVATLQSLKQVHSEIEQDEEVDLEEHVAREFIDATAEEKVAAERARAAKATVLDLMGKARLAKFDGKTVARRQANGYGVSLVPVSKGLSSPSVVTR